jgi:hypothetical protein
MNVESEIRSLASGIRAVALVFTLIVGYFNIRLAFLIRHFQGIFSDMLGDKPLPGLTQLIVQGRPIFLLLALLIPILAVAAVVLIRHQKIALYSLGALMLVAFLQLHLTWTGLFAPLISIVDGLSANDGP